jgi:capsular polysaccharide biosynthesis protein
MVAPRSRDKQGMTAGQWLQSFLAVVVFGLVGLAIAVVVVVSSTETFTASSEVLIDATNASAGIGPHAIALPEAVAAERYAVAQQYVIDSPLITTAAARSLGIPWAEIRNGVSAGEVSSTDVITVHVTLSSKSLARRVADSVVMAYVDERLNDYMRSDPKAASGIPASLASGVSVLSTAQQNGIGTSRHAWRELGAGLLIGLILGGAAVLLVSGYRAGACPARHRQDRTALSDEGPN